MLIQRHAGIGDIICTLPSIITLRRNEPGTMIIYETRRDNVPMVECCPFVDLAVEEGTVLAMCCHRFLKPKLVLYPLLSDERTPPGQRKRIHLVEEFGKSFGLSSVGEQGAKLEVSVKEREQMRLRLRKANWGRERIGVIHTGPTWRVKEWPAAKWRELVMRMKEELGVVVIQIGHDYHGTGETCLSPRIDGAVDWVGQLSIKQMIALLETAKLFVGIDSGMLHLAGAASTPIVGLFGPTDPDCFLPREGPARGVTSGVECLGCHHDLRGPRHWRNGCPHNIRCMAELRTDEVFSVCSQLLNERRKES
jgi:ADP-heptose:LPS heptosyltransferase